MLIFQKMRTSGGGLKFGLSGQGEGKWAQFCGRPLWMTLEQGHYLNAVFFSK